MAPPTIAEVLTQLQQELNNERRSNTELRDELQRINNALDVRETIIRNHDNTQGPQTTQLQQELNDARRSNTELRDALQRMKYGLDARGAIIQIHNNPQGPQITQRNESKLESRTRQLAVLKLKYEKLTNDYAELKESSNNPPITNTQENNTQPDSLTEHLIPPTPRTPENPNNNNARLEGGSTTSSPKAQDNQESMIETEALTNQLARSALRYGRLKNDYDELERAYDKLKRERQNEK